MFLQDQLSRPFLDMLQHAASTTPPQTATSWLTTAAVVQTIEAVFDPASLGSLKNTGGREFLGLPLIESDTLPTGAVVLRAGLNTVGKFEIDEDYYWDFVLVGPPKSGAA